MHFLFYYNAYSIIVFIVCIGLYFFLCGALFKKDDFFKIYKWKKRFQNAYWINVVSFYVVSMMFILNYGWITDDTQYFFYEYWSPGYRQPHIWEITAPKEFMGFINYPFKT